MTQTQPEFHGFKKWCHTNLQLKHVEEKPSLDFKLRLKVEPNLQGQMWLEIIHSLVQLKRLFQIQEDAANKNKCTMRSAQHFHFMGIKPQHTETRGVPLSASTTDRTNICCAAFPISQVNENHHLDNSPMMRLPCLNRNDPEYCKHSDLQTFFYLLVPDFCKKRLTRNKKLSYLKPDFERPWCS